MRNLPPPLTLETERLLLTLPGAEHAQRVVNYFATNREHLAPWEPPFPKGMFTTRFWERRLVQNQQEYRSGTSMRLVLLKRDDPEGPVHGLTNFTQFVRGAFMACTLGYSLDHDAEAKGLMHEALSAGLTHCFEKLRMHRVMANYLPINERSGRLLKRLGFEVEGYARDYIFIDGAWRDHILTARTNPQPKEPDYMMSAGDQTRSAGPTGGNRR
jgi:ribosomal-protein-alanine N-acetyltransferase